MIRHWNAKDAAALRWMLVRLLTDLRPLRLMPIWLRYLLTCVVVLAFFCLRLALASLDAPERLPLFLVFMPGVILAAVIFDRGSGFLAVALSSVLGLFSFVEPVGFLALTHPGDIVRLVFFVMVGVFTAVVVEALRSTVEELAVRGEELRLSEARLKEANRRATLLLDDINHRMKNHLASIAATLSMSARDAKDPRTREVLEAAVSRIRVLGQVYGRLHLAGAVAAVDLKDFLETLCADLGETIIGMRPVALTAQISGTTVPAEMAVTLGLIVNELVQNAVKHAFPDDRAGGSA